MADFNVKLPCERVKYNLNRFENHHLSPEVVFPIKFKSVWRCPECIYFFFIYPVAIQCIQNAKIVKMESLVQMFELFRTVMSEWKGISITERHSIWIVSVVRLWWAPCDLAEWIECLERDLPSKSNFWPQVALQYHFHPDKNWLIDWLIDSCVQPPEERLPSCPRSWCTCPSSAFRSGCS